MHVHANNIGGVIPGTALPETLEITFLNAALMSGTSRRSTSPEYPIRGLDMPCSAKLPDLPIHFVHHEARPTTDKGHG